MCYCRAMIPRRLRPALALWVVLALPAGCLYVGGQNRKPQGSIAIEHSSARLEKYGSVTLLAKASDPDEDTLSYQWRVQVTDTSGVTYGLTDASGPAPEGGYRNYKRGTSVVIGTSSELTLNRLPLRGSYAVTLSIRDDGGAEHLAQRTFAVNNVAPAGITLKIGPDPRYDARTRGPDSAGAYPAHGHYLVWLDTAKLVDPERDLRCGTGASVRYTLEAPSSLKWAYAVKRSCQGGEALDAFAFSARADSLSKTTRVTVRAEVDDGHGGTGSGSLALDLAPNRAPCIQGTSPAFAVATQAKPGIMVTVPVVAEQGLRFDVSEVWDDVEEPYIYRWMVKDTKEFRVIPGQISAGLQLQPWFRLPGQSVELRVAVRDPLSPSPTCAESTPFCGGSAGHPAGCYQWVTWKVVFR